ncbi:sensor histidine kinase [Kitasatospora sp. NPDC056327]|uniref:sensor histidine kinase n=1 Tax=Kitasatospora sp. NPDC056327 TaxID=3345785 RepID=UPI0035D660ED
MEQPGRPARPPRLLLRRRGLPHRSPSDGPRQSRPPGPGLLGWYAPGRNRLLDTLLLTAVLGLAAEETVVEWAGDELPLRPLRITGAALASLSVLLARRHPVAAAVLPVLVSGLLNRAFPGLFSVYHLASTGRSGPALAAAAAIAALSAVRADSVLGWAGIAGSQLLVEAAALSLGLWLHGRRMLIRTLHAKVDALRRERELRAEQARSAERARIAREMHDVLAHRLSLLVLHAGVLRDQARAGTVADDQERLAHRLELLRATAARSLDDLRDVLGALRAEPFDPPDPPDARAAKGVPADSSDPPVRPGRPAGPQVPVPVVPPEPGLPEPGPPVGVPSTGTGHDRPATGPAPPGTVAPPRACPGVADPAVIHRTRPRPVAAPALRDLAELVGEAAGIGQRVELAVTGDAESVPTTHRLAVHRVVQEALTNARKYAHTAPVTVRVRYGEPATTVEVHSGAGVPAPSGASTGGGYGLVGLGERIGALGGHFDAGPDGRDGFRLAARLPAPERPPVRPPGRPVTRPPGPAPGESVGRRAPGAVSTSVDPSAAPPAEPAPAPGNAPGNAAGSAAESPAGPAPGPAPTSAPEPGPNPPNGAP